LKIFKSLISLCAVIGLLVVMTGCPSTANREDSPQTQGRVNFTFFDTVSYVYSYAGDSQEVFEANVNSVFEILGEYHRLFDIYYEHSGVTNLRTLNKNAGGEAMVVDEKLIDFLLYAKELYEVTDSEMNIMMGSVLRLWHDCREEASASPSNAKIPAMDKLTEAAKHTDISLLEIDEENMTVFISDPDASIDVGALGKGYATEKAAEYLRSVGAESYVLNIGGNIRIIGHKPDGGSWGTGIKDPSDTSRYATTINIANTSCVTSGDYERFFTVGGKRYHHIIDKDTLMPSEFFSSVTIITSDSGLADALSTALFSMSYEDGLALVSSLSGVEVLWILPSGELRMTDGFIALQPQK
jgi:thiamine biosynthesis lipoprotein